MRFSFSDEQRELARMLRGLLQKSCPLTRVRDVMLEAEGHDPALWSRLCEELGLAALVIPEEYGGAGFGSVELAAVMEELGRSLAPVPFLSATLGAQALLRAGSDAQRNAHLPSLASGERRATLAFPQDCQLTFRQQGDGFALSGRITRTLDAHAADLVIAPAVGANGDRALFILEETALNGRKRLATLDATRPWGELHVNATLPVGARLPGDAPSVLQQVAEYGAIALATEQVGLAEACLEMAVDYAKTRTQFERPIGSFQAIKHKCADMLLKVESARSAAYYAAWALSVDAPDVSELAHLAAAYCGEAAFECAAENIQVHGGIGFSWEHDAHLYFKRARASERLFGAPALHREAVAQLWLDGAAD
ncbi:MAG: acyl-CoA dehydrogenase family protein [Polyangiaceae bacterium]